MRTILVFLAVLVVVAVVAFARSGDRPAPANVADNAPAATTASTPAPQPVVALDLAAAAAAVDAAKPVPFRTDRASDRPHHVLSRLPPGTIVPITELPKVKEGIRMPDGTLLPFLNGMTFAPPAAISGRNGPLAPVVAKAVDEGGFEWWVHADGSTTTCRYKQVTVMGKTYWDPGTEHWSVRKRDDMVDIGVGGGGSGGGGNPPK